ncbi:hypothetical protein [Bordetella flabilis]|uniref:Uncharacterized protein n=1 Tax=Bordetella flabilis TaxID=463014 RepID=A0A193GI13_9BORD|nr:hypothetical protein [Bordetella flabilis]ANN78914.1 hypothetical protein BAU07_18915 [Bordetella flabilis]
MSDAVKVKTLRPVLFEGTARTEFTTTEQHRRELVARGLVQPDTAEAIPETAVDSSTLLSKTVPDVIDQVGRIGDVEQLTALLDAEKSAKNRKGVLDAIEAAIAALGTRQ